MKRIFFRYKPDWERTPWWMGYAWRRWDCYDTAVALIPFNILLRLVRSVWIWVARRYAWDDVTDKAYKRGKEDGIKIGRTQGVLDEQSRMFDEFQKIKEDL